MEETAHSLPVSNSQGVYSGQTTAVPVPLVESGDVLTVLTILGLGNSDLAPVLVE